MNIRYELLAPADRKKLPDCVSDMPFGALRTNHMFLMDYSDGKWHDARIVPYGPIPLMPGAVVLHYGQGIFEGAKAFRHPDNEIYLWRFDKNAARINHSARNICMAEVPEDIQKEQVVLPHVRLSAIITLWICRFICVLRLNCTSNALL